MTDEGETEAATLACWELKADCTAGGTATPAGKLRPSAPMTRMVNKPDLNVRFSSFPSGFPGVGVVERLLLISSALRLVTDAFLLLSQDIVKEWMIEVL